jgi:arginine/lysine/ornithine decarboxylase
LGERQTPIMDALHKVAGNAAVRLCMPGHKGDTGFFGGELLRCDITELPGADNLLCPSGAIAASEALHAEFVDADAAFFTTGGSTAGNLAMLSLFRGKKVIFPRGIHLSAANAISLFSITPVFLEAAPCDYPAVTSAEAVRAALKAHRDAAAVFVTYPNYFGLCCELEAIAAAAHRAGAALLVDAAHAAHFAYSPLLPAYPAQAGADIWTESIHKTLPAMNQCACVLVGRGSLVDKTLVRQAISMVQTTSPSYVLLGSLDYACAYMRDKGEAELARAVRFAEKLCDSIAAIPGCTCAAMPHSAARDPLKVVIDVEGTGYTGLAMRDALAAQGIHVETADLRNLLLMLSVGNTPAQLDTFRRALAQVPRIRGKSVYFSPYSLPAFTKYSQSSWLWGNIDKVRIERSAGLISAGAVGVYPPGEAVLLRGQQISYEISGYLLEARRQGFDLFGAEDDCVRVYRERI